jgi:hypothetical protein
MMQLIKRVEKLHGKDFSKSGEYIKLKSKGFMDLNIENIGQNLIAISHYYEENGDLIPDPDVQIWIAPDGNYYPIAYQNNFGYRRYAELENNNTSWSRADLRGQAELASFCNQWSTNLRNQEFV